MPTLEEVLQTASELPAEQQEMLADILRQRQNQAWRRRTAAEARESFAAFHEGRLPPLPAEAVIAELRAGMDSPENE